MNTPFDDRMDHVFEPFERNHDRLRAELMASLPAEAPETPQATGAAGWQFWKGISPMQRRVLQVAGGMAVAAALALAFLWPAPRGSGVVLADVLDRLLAAQTVTFRMFTYVQGNVVESADIMIMDRRMRIDTSDGLTCISDGDRGRFLALDAAKQTATMLETVPWQFDFFQALAELRAAAETALGERTIDGRKALGFSTPDASLSIWIDAQTHGLIQMRTTNIVQLRQISPTGHETPLILMEEGVIGPDGLPLLETVFRDFVFDAALESSAFDLSIPEEYALGEVDTPLVREATGSARAASVHHSGAPLTARRLAMACHLFAVDNDNAWPEKLDLESLAAYGVDEQALVNPRQPALVPGWVYVRPSLSRNEMTNPGSIIILHEAFTTWDGVVAAFADGHVEFINSQDYFEELLAR